MRNWGDNIEKFLELANRYNVRMILVGGGAVNFHGYHKYSAIVDFRIDTYEDHMTNLAYFFKDMGYKINQFLKAVMVKKQNISLKFSPYDLDLELITRFSVCNTFEEAYKENEEDLKKGNKLSMWNVLSLEDLITSKIKSSRPKDLLDTQQLKQNNNK